MALGAFLAGLASFLSPCVLPLIPVYLAYLAGTTCEGLLSGASKRLVLLHAFCFVLGFSFVFIVVLGVPFSMLGSALLRQHVWLERVGGAVLILLGLWMIGWLKAAFLYREARWHFHEKPAGLLGSVVVGAAFAAGWTPCVGPVLAAILMLASREGSVLKGMFLLSVYSAGFALPLLACALAVDKALPLLKRLTPVLPAVERAMGAVITALGVLLAGGWYSRASSWALSWMKFH
ncbi:MAG: cytochrome c biogenesis protein CcdA [Elusimicrobia bacterium]|nr:cytochrome c biogenesis protein CcdA [Elusimicrobiota bacterium]